MDLSKSYKLKYGGISEQDSLDKQSCLNTVKVHINIYVFKNGIVQEEKHDERPCDPVPMTYTELLSMLLEKGFLVPILSKHEEELEEHNIGFVYGYHSGSMGHVLKTEKC